MKFWEGITGRKPKEEKLVNSFEQVHGVPFSVLPNRETATDTQTAGFFATHIENPCSTKTSEGEWVKLRNLYITGAKSALTKMNDPSARKLLSDTINQYER